MCFRKFTFVQKCQTQEFIVLKNFKLPSAVIWNHVFVQAPVMWLCSLLDKTPQEKHEPLYPSNYGLNGIIDILLQGWLWH